MKNKECVTCLPTDIGNLVITGTPEGVSSIGFSDEAISYAEDSFLPRPIQETKDQLKEYLSGARRSFTSLRFLLPCTTFQEHVWDQVQTVSFGTTATYSDIAKAIGNPNAVRSVGTAIGRNILAVIVPCHRIVPSSTTKGDTDIGEYAWGAWRKEWLLEHEEKYI